jgi:hypothetical protein
MDFQKNEEIVHFCADKLTFYGHNLRSWRVMTAIRGQNGLTFQ